MKDNYIVKKSNYFIMNSSYDLSLEEQRIILTLASMVKPEDENFKPYKFNISEFMVLLGLETKTKYSEVPKITKELMKKVFEIIEGNKLIQVAWLSSAEYEKGSGTVELEFSPKLKPYMLHLKERFTQYQLKNVLSMKSKYSIRIYEILKCNEFKEQKYIEIDIIEFRKLIKAENYYPLYGDFKRRIILQAQKEINELTDITFEFEEIKTGRKVTSIRFYIKPKKIIRMNPKDVHINEEEEIDHRSLNDSTSGDTMDNSSLSEDKPSNKLINALRQDFKNMFKEEISDGDIEMLFDIAKGNIDKVKEKMELAKNYRKPIGSLIGFLKSAIEEDYKASQIKVSSSHNDVPQMRNYSERHYEPEFFENLYKNKV